MSCKEIQWIISENHVSLINEDSCYQYENIEIEATTSYVEDICDKINGHLVYYYVLNKDVVSIHE